MKVIQATKHFDFNCPVFGQGRLKQGTSYFSYGKFARDVSSLGAATILQQEECIAPFSRRVLLNGAQESRVLLIHSGGYGDTISAGILLHLLKAKYNISFDICCHRNKWESILKPLGFEGDWIAYPPDLERLEAYDYLLDDLTKFVDDRTMLPRKSPLKLLTDAFNLSLDSRHVRYRIPNSVKTRMVLSPSNKIRIGVNFDSMGAIKSYPEDLQARFIEQLLLLGSELYFSGTTL